MAILEELIGQDLSQISDEELRQIVERGRLAREEEAASRLPKKKAAKKKVEVEDEIDLSEWS